MDNYNLLIEGPNGNIMTQFVMTDVDLIDQYKTALLQGKGFVIWENGVIDCSKILGITRNPAPKKVT